MREFERAIERGEDITVANFVLEQLRKVVRGTEEDDEARPRTDDPARLLYRPLEPFLVESNFPVRPGRSAAHRCCRSGNGWSATGRPRPRANSKPRSPRSGRAAATPTSKARPASSSSPQPTRSSSRRRRSRATTGSGRSPVSARLMSSRTCCRSAGVLRAREALETLGSRMPGQMRVFSESQIATVGSALNVPSLQTPQLLPFALSLIMQRLTAPWQIIRLAIKMAASDDEIRVAATPYGVAVTIALHDLSFLTACLRTDIRRGHFENVAEHLKILARWRARLAHRARPPQRFRRGAASSRRSAPKFPIRCSRRSRACPAGSAASCVSAPTRIFRRRRRSKPGKSKRPPP